MGLSGVCDIRKKVENSAKIKHPNFNRFRLFGTCSLSVYILFYKLCKQILHKVNY